MNIKRTIIIAVAVIAVTVITTACRSQGNHKDEPSEMPKNENPSVGSSIPASDSTIEGTMNCFLSAHLEQRETTGLLYWELDITDTEELKLLADLLNVDDLSPLKKGQSKWAEGGVAIVFEMSYADVTIEGACNPQTIQQSENRSTLRMGEVYYAYPVETGNTLLKFLKDKNITVVE